LPAAPAVEFPRTGVAPPLPPTAPPVPERPCIGCRRVAARTHLVRLVREPAPDGAAPRVRVDPTRSAPGRGAWLHPDSSCLDLALRRGGFPRAFRGVVDTGQLVRDLGTPDPTDQWNR